jgi:hypothetical protein
MYGTANPTFTLFYDGFINGNTAAGISEKPTGATTATASSNAGEYLITCSGGSATNYSFTYETGKLTVTKAPLTATSNVECNYGANNPTFSITYSGFKNSDSEISLTVQPQVTCTATAASSVGSYPIIVSGGEDTNYDINCMDGILTVAKAPLTVIAQSSTSVYGDMPPAYTCQYFGFVNSETENVLTQLPSLICTATSLSDAGEYSIVPSNAEAQNYIFSYQSGTLTIQKRNLQVRPDNVSRIYGDANPAFTLSYSGFVNGNTEADITVAPTASTTTTIGSNVGAYPIIISGGKTTNYDFNYTNGILTINKAPLTIQVQDIQRSQSEDNQSFTLLYSGFKNDEDESVLDQLPAVSCNADRNSPTGFYDIVLSDGSDNNYTYNFINGILEVTKGSGIEDISVQLSVYPNPVRQDLFIKSDCLIEKVEVYSTMGHLAIAKSDFTGKIEMQTLPESVYFVKIYIENKIITHKIVKN